LKYKIDDFSLIDLMKLKPKTTIEQHFSAMEDKRVERTKRHLLIDIITITLWAVIGGAETWDVEWKHLNSVARVQYYRTLKNGKTKLETRYFITSLSHKAQQLSQSIRGHWSIENQWHWVLDVEFNEDDSRIRKDNAPENLAIIRHIALNLLKQDKTEKRSIRSKRNRAGWDNNYLLDILTNQ
jgi:predicted transposase YbfD/YdcC